jgi:hypothetical protein
VWNATFDESDASQGGCQPIGNLELYGGPIVDPYSSPYRGHIRGSTAV